MSLLPGWDSLEATARIDKWAQWSVIALLIFGALLQIISLVYQSRHKALTDVASQAKEQKQEDETTAVQLKLQSAHETIEDLRAK